MVIAAQFLIGNIIGYALDAEPGKMTNHTNRAFKDFFATPSWQSRDDVPPGRLAAAKIVTQDLPACHELPKRFADVVRIHHLAVRQARHVGVADLLCNADPLLPGQRGDAPRDAVHA